jgi:hypothetical protein
MHYLVGMVSKLLYHNNILVGLFSRARNVPCIYLFKTTFFVLACKDPKALGMQSGNIPNSRLKASSEWNRDWGPGYGRLHGSKCWIARPSNTNQWLQIDFKYRATVTEILTQGRRDANQWVRSYTVAYSDDGINFKAYRVDKGQDKVKQLSYLF